MDQKFTIVNKTLFLTTDYFAISAYCKLCKTQNMTHNLRAAA